MDKICRLRAVNDSLRVNCPWEEKTVLELQQDTLEKIVSKSPFVSAYKQAKMPLKGIP